MTLRSEYDAVVIGAGFGGIGAALSLAERGANVALLETLRYPGGCAGTFTRKGFSFEAGATLSSGFAEGQLFQRWIKHFALDVELEWLNPVIHFRSAHSHLDISPSREDLIEQFCALPGAPKEGIVQFFQHQKAVADALWRMLRPSLLPDGLCSVVHRVNRQLWPCDQDMNRSLTHVMGRYGIADFKPLKLYLDALCQSVQCNSTIAEAPFALYNGLLWTRDSTCDRWIGQARDRAVQSDLSAVETSRFQIVQNQLSRLGWGYLVHTRRGTYQQKHRLESSTHRDEAASAHRYPLAILGESPAERSRQGLGAAMFYLVAEGQISQKERQNIGNSSTMMTRPMEGNHVFCSTSSQHEKIAPMGSHTLTLSTHIPMSTLRSTNRKTCLY